MPERQHREPIDRSIAGGITMKEIKARVRELHPDLTTDQLQSALLLFAMLKEGKSIVKLHLFTKWPVEVLQAAVAGVKDPGLRYTSAPSTQFVLSQIPGCEDLIEKITGQRIVRETTVHRAPAGYDWQRHMKTPPKPILAQSEAISDREEKPRMTTVTNSLVEAGADLNGAETCGKSPFCGKPTSHLGRCKGEGGSAERAHKKANGGADQPKAKTPKPKPAQPNGRKLQAATAILAAPDGASGRFKIEYEDENLTLNIEGLGREAFTATMEMIHTSLTGGPNG